MMNVDNCNLYRSIPSIETEGVSVLDEYYWLNKEDPNYSLMRATMNRGQDGKTDGKFAISDEGAKQIMKLFFTADEKLFNKPITDFFGEDLLNSNFWFYWRTIVDSEDAYSYGSNTITLTPRKNIGIVGNTSMRCVITDAKGQKETRIPLRLVLYLNMNSKQNYIFY